MISPKEPCRFNSVPVYAYDRKACALECAIRTGLLCGLLSDEDVRHLIGGNMN